MIPTTVPEHIKAARPWCRVVNMGPPPGVSDADCGTAEMLISAAQDPEIPGFEGRANYVYFRPSVEELAQLAAGGVIEFAQYGHVVQPFSAAVWPSE